MYGNDNVTLKNFYIENNISYGKGIIVVDNCYDYYFYNITM